MHRRKEEADPDALTRKCASSPPPPDPRAIADTLNASQLEMLEDALDAYPRGCTFGDCWTHVLRHCWASAAVRLKVQPSHIQQALGWRSLAMISTYVHVGADELRESIDAVAAAQIGGPHG